MLTTSSESLEYGSFPRWNSTEALGSLSCVPTDKFFKIPESKKQLQSFFKEFLKSNGDSIQDLSVDNILLEAKRRGLDEQLQILGFRYASELVEFELAYQQFRRFEVTSPLDLQGLKFQERETLFDDMWRVSAVIRQLLEDETHHLVNERAELETRRLLMDNECSYDILKIILYDYKNFLENRIPSPLSLYHISIVDELQRPISIEVLVDRLFHHFYSEEIEELERMHDSTGLTKSQKVGQCKIDHEGCCDERISLLLKSLESDNYDDALDELAGKLDGSERPKSRNFSLDIDSDNIVFSFLPQLSLRLFDKTQEILRAKIDLKISGICAPTFTRPHFQYALSFSDIVFHSSAAEARNMKCVRTLLEYFSNWKKDDSTEQTVIPPLDIERIRGHFFPSLGSPRKLLASPGGVLKTHSFNFSRVTQTKRSEQITVIKSTSALRKLSQSKKSLKHLQKDVVRYLPTLVGLIPDSKEKICTILKETLPGYDSYQSSTGKLGERYRKRLEKGADTVHDYYPLSNKLRKITSDFYFVDHFNERLNIICSLPRKELISSSEFQTRILSKNILIRLLGRSYRKLPKQMRARLACERIFYNVYYAGYQDHTTSEEKSEKDILLLSELQSRRFFGMCFDPIHWFVSPYLEGESVQNIEAQFRTLFPNLNQVEPSDGTSISSGSGEDLAMSYSLTSSRAKVRPKVFANRKDGVYLLRHDYTFLVTQGDHKKPFAQLVFSHCIKQIDEEKRCERFYKIRDISFAVGADLKAIEYMIEEILRCSHGFAN